MLKDLIGTPPEEEVLFKWLDEKCANYIVVVITSMRPEISEEVYKKLQQYHDDGLGSITPLVGPHVDITSSDGLN